MKSKKFLAALLVCVAIFVCAFSVSAAPTGDFTDFNGWWYEPSDDETYYFEDGVLVTDKWITEQEETYYVGADGYRYCDGIFTIGGKLYAFDDNGKMLSDGLYQLYDYQNNTWSYYYASADGSLYINRWVQPFLADGIDTWYYLGADGVAYQGKQKVGNAYYYFDAYDATLHYGAVEVYDEEMQEWLYYYAQEGDADGALAQNKWLKDQDGDWTYYDSNHLRINNAIAWINGKLYAFDDNGKMLDDGLYQLYDYQNDTWSYYYASADGSLYVNRWVQPFLADGIDTWYYLGADGKAYSNGAYKVGNAYYYFYSDGEMASDTEVYSERWDEELGVWINLGTYRARENGALYVNTWYQDGSNRYYYGANGKAPVGIVTVDGKKYAFNNYGRVLYNEVTSFYADGAYKHLIATADGTPYEAPNNKWTKVDGKWYYVQNNEFCYDNIYLIGGKYYAFKWTGQMYENELFNMSVYDPDGYHIGWSTFYAKADGLLAQNETISITYDGDTEIYFFGENFYVPDVYGMYEHNGTYYYLNGSERPLSYGFVTQEFDGVYAFGNDGKGKKLGNGWYHNTFNEDKDYWCWMFVWNDTLARSGIMEIGGKEYAFDSDGALLADRIYYDDAREEYVLLTAINEKGQGGFVCEETNVWKTVNGDYVYLTANATLHNGWLFDKYYMTPYMTYCDFALDNDGYVYTFNTAGQSQRVTATGCISVHGETFYVENGKLVSNVWKKLQNGWYYFGEYGKMYVNTPAKINDVLYFFDFNGRMCDNGWFRDLYGDWYWAAKSGALYTGKDSAGYVFAEDGVLIVNNVYEIDGVWYITDKDGKAVGSFNKAGWNKVNNNWYYVHTYSNGDDTWYDVAKGSFYTADGRFYAFDHQGRMLTNRFYEDNHYYLGGDGAMQRWFKVDGYWYYGDPDDYGCLYTDGIYHINDKPYLFDGLGKLQQNVTVYSWEYDAMVTTDSEGIVVKQTPANGWMYEVDTRGGEGFAYYYMNGAPYTGWLGNYYIDYGYMYVDGFVYDEKTDTYCYINKKGIKQGAGWYERQENRWIYVRADGTIVYNDWLKIGAKWYYFSEYYMAYGGFYEIDGTRHLFDENGVWLGEYEKLTPDCTNRKDGWFQLNGKWYFAMAGEAVAYTDLYINGKWYHFFEDGSMAANTFAYTSHSVHENYRYYTADGSAVSTTGWQRINNRWVYFDKEYTAKIGWINVNGKTYYQGYFFNEDAYYWAAPESIGIVTGYQVINRVLYQFNSDGALVKTITAKGWYKVGTDWYYIDADGYTVCHEDMYKIGNAYYAFDFDGKMIANDIYNGHYYNASGAMVTKAGWYQIGNKWVYVLNGGTVAQYGVFRINNKDYYFYDGYWLA